MAALLTAQQITAVESRITSLTTIANEIRDMINALYAAIPNARIMRRGDRCGMPTSWSRNPPWHSAGACSTMRTLT